MNLTEKELTQFFVLRTKIFLGIDLALKQDGHHKSYEGALSIQFPNFFQDDDGTGQVQINLSCYVLGPSRHYEWKGKTLGEACEKANKDVSEWIEDLNRPY